MLHARLQVVWTEKTHDENILKLTNLRMYQKQMNLYNAGTTIQFVALCLWCWIYQIC